jgi:hypothetical protein
MIQRIPPRLRRRDEDAQISRRLLPDELVERLRPERGIDISGLRAARRRSSVIRRDASRPCTSRE